MGITFTFPDNCDVNQIVPTDPDSTIAMSAETFPDPSQTNSVPITFPDPNVCMGTSENQPPPPPQTFLWQFNAVIQFNALHTAGSGI